MADAPKKILVDDDWKAEARREKEKLAEQAAGRSAAPPPAADFIGLINLIAMQAMAALGLLAGPGGERIPPNLGAAKHFVDMLQMLEDKTKGNLSAEEQKLLDQVLYEMRMRFIQMSSAVGGAPPGAPG
jgi:hypothetical protein